jgi:cell division septal protein FtsQ
MKRFLYALFIIPVCLLSAVTIAYLFSKGGMLFSVRSVRVNGLSQLTESEVVAKIGPFLNTSIFQVDVEGIERVLATHAYVREARIKRVFPFSLIVDVREKQPAAMWVTSTGDVMVLDELGEPYRRIMRYDRGLFLISAPDKEAAKAVFQQVERWTHEGIIKNEAISEVAYHDGGITLFGREQGVQIILGREEQQKRLKKALAILHDARQRGLLIRCIDARFEKGAIIQERKG